VTIAYGCCVGSWDKFQRNVVPVVGDREHPLMTLSGQTSIAVAYNTILEAFEGRRDLDALILLHDDLEIADPQAAEKFLAALADPDVALVGVAGGGKGNGLAWWTDNPVGHQLTDSMMIDFGPRTGDVAILEGSILVFSPWAIKNLRFSEEFPGFHGYDAIAQQAWARKKRCTVVDVDTYHHSRVGFKSPESEADWVRWNESFMRRWGT